MKELVRAKVLKPLDARIIYLILDSAWITSVQCTSKIRGITTVHNENN